MSAEFEGAPQGQEEPVDTGRRPSDLWLQANYHAYDHLTNGLLEAKYAGRKLRRLALAETFQHGGFPIELHISDKGKERALALKEEGYSFVAPYNHERFRDPIDGVHAIIALGGDFTDADFSAPVAHHQNKPYINALTAMLDMQTAFLVTESTVRKHENFEKPTKGDHAKEIFSRAKHRLAGEPFVAPERKELRLNHGHLQSRALSVETLLNGGVVIIAPGTERRPELGQQNKRPIEFILKEAQRKGVDKIAFLPMGLVLDSKPKPKDDDSEKDPDPEEASKEIGVESSGLHRGKKVIVEIREPITLDELIASANKNRINMDQQIFIEIESRMASARDRLAA